MFRQISGENWGDTNRKEDDIERKNANEIVTLLLAAF